MSTKLLLYLGFESLQPAVWSINLLLGKLSKINNVLAGKNNMFRKKSVILMTSYCRRAQQSAWAGWLTS